MAQSLSTPLTPDNDNQANDATGHNMPPVEALYLTHLSACRAQDQVLKQANEAVKAVRQNRSKVRNVAKNDGFPLWMMDFVLWCEGKTRSDVEGEMAQLLSMMAWSGQPNGVPQQLELDLSNTPAEIKDAITWEAEGYAAGIRARDPVAPDTCPPRFVADFMKGWHAGQERNAWALSERGLVVDRNPEVRASPVSLEPVNDDAADSVAA